MIILENTTFKVHAIKGYIATLYLVEYTDRLLLLDGGCRCDAHTIVLYIQSIERTIKELQLIVVTHPHPDHSGGAPILQKQYNIPIAASPQINEWYTGISGWLTQQVDILLTYYVARKKKQPWKSLFFPRHIHIDHPIIEYCSELPGFPDWNVIPTPGHTSTDTSVYHKQESIAYIADLIIGLGTRYKSPYPISKPTLYKKSLEDIRDLSFEHCLLAHHGTHFISADTFNQVIDSVSPTPKNHKNSIATRLGFR